MKKGKILVITLVGLLMAGGLIMTGCDEEMSCYNGCFYSKNSSWTDTKYGCTNKNCSVQRAMKSKPSYEVECNCN